MEHVYQRPKENAQQPCGNQSGRPCLNAEYKKNSRPQLYPRQCQSDKVTPRWRKHIVIPDCGGEIKWIKDFMYAGVNKEAAN
jgi:hypothetical protein